MEKMMQGEKEKGVTDPPMIMLVDDTPENLSLLREILSTSGYQVAAFPNGHLAIRAAEKRKPDLILLDINMPGMNGYEVCEKIKSNPELKAVPIIFLSALSEAGDKLKAFKVGGVDYITKPFHAEEVHARVNAQLSIYLLQKDLAEKNARLAEANNSLKELEELRDTLVHTVVHDMRSLLMVVVGFLELLPDIAHAPDAEAKRREYSRKALCASELLVEMSSAILDVSRMESETLSLSRSRFDLVGAARESADRLEPLRGERTVVFEMPEGPLYVEADENLVGRVILNLLSNALKFSPERDGRITIRLLDLGGSVHFAVGDNGPGIHPDDVDRVFDKYWQGTMRARGAKHSTGLGLTFCHMAITAHGGKMGVETKLGEGSVFWFEL